MPRDGDDRRQVLLVDERDARLRARVAGDQPDEQGDHDRIREQRAEQERRAPSTRRSFRSTIDTALIRTPPRRQRRSRTTGPRRRRGRSGARAPARRVATSSRFCVAKQTAPPSPRSAFTTSQTRAPLAGSSDAVGSSRSSTRGSPSSDDRDVQPLTVPDRERRRSAVCSPERKALPATPSTSPTPSSRANSSRFSRTDSRRYGRAAAAAPSRRARAARRCPASARARRRGSRAASTCRRRWGRRARPSRRGQLDVGRGERLDLAVAARHLQRAYEQPPSPRSGSSRAARAAFHVDAHRLRNRLHWPGARRRDRRRTPTRPARRRAAAARRGRREPVDLAAGEQAEDDEQRVQPQRRAHHLRHDHVPLDLVDEEEEQRHPDRRDRILDERVDHGRARRRATGRGTESTP